MSCWSCGRGPVEDRFCAACDAIQPVDPSWTAFDVLGLPRAMRQDRATMDRAFRERSRRVHPDRFRGKSAVERRLALEQTTAVNEAFQKLKDPRRRAEYLLSLEGIEIGAEEHRTQDPALLMEMMERTEQIDSAKSAEERTRLSAQLSAESNEILSGLEAHFDEGAGDTATAAAKLERLRYLARLRERLEEKSNP